jgi:uncharacterized protein YjlB
MSAVTSSMSFVTPGRQCSSVAVGIGGADGAVMRVDSGDSFIL